MADQNITELPIKTNSGVANTDYMLGIDASEGYQILVRDVAKYIVENYNGSTLAGSAQTPKSAFDALNSNIYTEISTGIASSYGTLQYKCYKTGHIVGFAGQLVLTSDCPASTDIITGLPALGSLITNYPPVRMFNNTDSQYVDMNLRRTSSGATSSLSIYNRSALSSGASLRFNFTYCCE